MTHHRLHSSAETCHWGFFEAKLKPVLTIDSGDEGTVDTISGGPEVVPDLMPLDYPRAETPSHYMTMAMDPDLDQCVVRALRAIALLGDKRNPSREDAYTMCSLAADLRVRQTVNGSKGIHGMIEKSIVRG
jgi:acetamidase/formamidase